MNDLLGIGASGVRAYRTALSTVAENTANVDTPGYVRRQTNLKEINTHTNPTGVQAAAITRVWDDFKASDARLSSSDAARAATRTEWLGASENALPDGDTGVGAKVSTFYNAATTLSADPGSSVGRQKFLSSLDQAATGIRTSADALARVSNGIGDEADATARGINDDLASLATVNLALTRASGGSDAAASLADERDRLLDGLSAKIGIDTRFDAKGAATVSLTGNGDTPLLKDGAINLIAVERAADGRLAVSIRADTPIAIVPTGGSMAGLVDAAAQVAGSRSSLDAIAVDFAGKLNGWNAGGKTPTGAAGTALLAGTTAATLALAPGLTPASIAAAGSDGSVNGNLTALSLLRGTDGAEARLETLIGVNAQALATSRTEAATTSARSDNAFAARDAVSAVDLDREASDLLRFQQAYNGSAKVLQVAKDTLNTILQLF